MRQKKRPGVHRRRAREGGWGIYLYLSREYRRENPFRREAALEKPALPDVMVIITSVS